MKKELDTYRYLYKRDKPIIVNVLGTIVAVIAILKIFGEPLIGLLFGIGAGGIFVYESGIEIDFKNNKYRLINSFGLLSFGEWITLPPIEYVSVFSVNLVSAAYGRSGAKVTQKQNVIQVNLITPQNKRLRILETKEHEQAFKFAKEIADSLDLNIYDATNKEGKWINK